jgi:hypothetical protein
MIWANVSNFILDIQRSNIALMVVAQCVMVGSTYNSITLVIIVGRCSLTPCLSVKIWPYGIATSWSHNQGFTTTKIGICLSSNQRHQIFYEPLLTWVIGLVKVLAKKNLRIVLEVIVFLFFPIFDQPPLVSYVNFFFSLYQTSIT